MYLADAASGDIYRLVVSDLAIATTGLEPGVNLIRFVQKWPGWVWGVTGLLLTP